METTHAGYRRGPWNKGKIVGQKAPFKLKEIWAVRVRLQMQQRLRELALFNLGIDSKLRAGKASACATYVMAIALHQPDVGYARAIRVGEAGR